MSEPKTIARRIAFRIANRRMPKNRIDLPFGEINFKDTDTLGRFTTDTGKILPRRVTGVSAKMHRRINREIKRARAVNMMP